MKDITIILTVYNKEIYLGYSFTLLKEQYLKLNENDKKRIKFLIIDDHSTDGSLFKINEIFGENVPYELIQNEKRRNIAYVRWQALNNIRTDYFIFIDVDDLIVDDYLKTLLEVDLSSNMDMYQFKGRQYPEGYIMDYDSTWMPLKLIKTSFIKENNLNFNKDMKPIINDEGEVAVVAEDLEFFERFHKYNPKIESIDKIIIIWNYAVPNSLTKIQFPFSIHLVPKKGD